VPDTIDRKDNQIESLKLHILEITTAHEKELQQCLNEIEKMAHKTAEIDSITQELENCK
jgi:Asp-tRNA(Asn)/Glu-tRNA(Gln) amidotransferase C subunit